MKKDSEKAIFANQLRGLAVVAVIIVHWCGIFWGAREVVASYIHAPVLEGPSSSMLHFLTLPTFNYGPFGVAVFYLISGFVIPFSLARSSPLKFLVARAFRIYPTYIAASFIMIGLVYLSSRYWGQPFTMPLEKFLWNLLLVQNNAGVGSIDLVNGTLSVEIKFYALAALMYSSIRSGNSYPIFLVSLATLAACQILPGGTAGFGMPAYLVDSLQTEFLCIIFMFIGTGFYHHYTGSYSTRQLAAYALILLIIFLLCWPHTSWANQIPSSPQNYVYGLIVFGVSYSLRRFFRPIAPLDFMAKISYSVYVLHSIIGYLSLRILLDKGFTFPMSGLITLIFVLCLSYALHRLVEVPTMHMGKKMFKVRVAPAQPQQGV